MEKFKDLIQTDVELQLVVELHHLVNEVNEELAHFKIDLDCAYMRIRRFLITNNIRLTVHRWDGYISICCGLCYEHLFVIYDPCDELFKIELE
jgi:hypothetical protein